MLLGLQPCLSCERFQENILRLEDSVLLLGAQCFTEFIKAVLVSTASPGFSKVPGFSFGVQVTTISPLLAKIPLGPGPFHLSLRLCCALFPLLCSQLQPIAPCQHPTRQCLLVSEVGELPPCIFQGAKWTIYNSVTPCK